MASEEKVIRRIGVKLNPPAIVVVYETGNSLRKRTIPVREFFKTSNIKRAAENIRDRHSSIFEKAPLVQVEKMLCIIQETMHGHSLEGCLQKVEREFTVCPEEDLNKLDDELLQRKKELMNITFEENCVKPGDPNFKYDIEDDFDMAGPIETSGWDSENQDDDFEF
ncbi:centrosomal protein of 19 kDa-like [Ornithodoros turicata]|uniref:Centrosomal protein of 19 kDa n=1 Tax=Ornithodoros turicata TaxID=34597 RepID=A0A2R5L6G1_9ACAR